MEFKIQNCPNKGPGPLQRGDNHKITKMGWGLLKTLSQKSSYYMKAFWYNVDLG
jgi:hypothetical protein